jgi:hypothetical protein
MIQFIIYFLCGFCVTWLNLFMWGFSNGPANIAPYFALIGSLLLFIAADSLALFLPRIADSVGLIAAIFILPQSFTILLLEHSLTGFAISCLAPVVAGSVAVYQLWKNRSQKWLMKCVSPHIIVRTLFLFLPFVVFILFFDARFVLTLLLEGPPR